MPGTEFGAAQALTHISQNDLQTGAATGVPPLGCPDPAGYVTFTHGLNTVEMNHSFSLSNAETLFFFLFFLLTYRKRSAQPKEKLISWQSLGLANQYP